MRAFMVDFGTALPGPRPHGAISGEPNREADLPTEQACTQASSRLPRAHGHQGRTQGGGGAPGARAQAAFRLTAAPFDPRIAFMERLRQRADFLAAASGTKVPGAAFVLQARQRTDSGAPRYGFTVSKKVGNAVERNRVRRRLREIVRLAGHDRMRAGHDYVLIGRRAALRLPFARMTQDLETALRRVHAGRKTATK
jgi:ribonuclease P protein component